VIQPARKREGWIISFAGVARFAGRTPPCVKINLNFNCLFSMV
jgi:hypothetical protein